MQVGDRVFKVDFVEVNPANVAQACGLVLVVADFPQQEQRFLGRAQSFIVVAHVLVEGRKVQQSTAQAWFVPDFAAQTGCLLVAFRCLVGLAHARLSLRDQVKTLGNGTFVAEATLDIERLRVITQSVVLLIEVVVGVAGGVQDGGFLLIILQLDSQRQCATEVIEAALSVIAPDFNPTRVEQCVNVLRVTRQNLVVTGTSFFESSGILVQPRQGILNVGIVRQHLSELFI